METTEKVRIEELSVGDWVQDRKGNTAKIIGIELWSDAYEVNVRINGVDVGLVSASSCYPIPITPEILEKNGFGHNGKRWYTPELFTIERGLNDWTRVIGGIDYYEYEVYTIKYVHQLQKAMKLERIEKEIEV